MSNFPDGTTRYHVFGAQRLVGTADAQRYIGLVSGDDNASITTAIQGAVDALAISTGEGGWKTYELATVRTRKGAERLRIHHIGRARVQDQFGEGPAVINERPRKMIATWGDDGLVVFTRLGFGRRLRRFLAREKE